MEVTQQEFDLIRASIKSAYPTFNVMPDQYSIRMWYRMLGDLDYKLCETALMELFATHTYPPQILEANAEKGQELNSELSENMSDLESLKQNTQNSLESAKSEKAKIEHKKALLDKLGLGQHLERGISDLENNQKELGDINKELIDAQREISATSTKLDLL